ncbi:MAG: MGMT family protein [Candidatus Bathyarchaeia archaeon]
MYYPSVKEIDGVWFSVVLEGEKIIACGFSCKDRKDVTVNTLENLSVNAFFSKVEPTGLALKILNNMRLIYVGKPANLTFKLDMDRLPPFTKKALQITSEIPRGSVTTYGMIAEAAGNKRAARAVGNAQAGNPFAPIVPCHRVIGSDFSLTGYGGGLAVKRAFLEREGVVFTGNRVVKQCLWRPFNRFKLGEQVNKTH